EVRLGSGLPGREGKVHHVDRLVDVMDLDGPAPRDDAPRRATLEVVPVHLEGDQLVARGVVLRAAGGADDDRAVVHDVVDREDVRATVVVDGEPADDPLAEQAPGLVRGEGATVRVHDDILPCRVAAPQGP